MIELNVSCPNVETGLVMGADPAETELRRRGGAAAHREAADREAHSQRRGSGRRGRGRRTRRRRRRFAHQHAQGHGASIRATAVPGSAGSPGASRAPRCARSPSSRSGRWPDRVELPVIGMGGIATGAPRRRLPARRGPGHRRRAPRAFGTPPRAGGSPPSCARTAPVPRLRPPPRRSSDSPRPIYAKRAHTSHARRPPKGPGRSADGRSAACRDPTTRIGNSSNPCGGHAAAHFSARCSMLTGRTSLMRHRSSKPLQTHDKTLKQPQAA